MNLHHRSAEIWLVATGLVLCACGSGGGKADSVAKTPVEEAQRLHVCIDPVAFNKSIAKCGDVTVAVYAANVIPGVVAAFVREKIPDWCAVFGSRWYVAAPSRDRLVAGIGDLYEFALVHNATVDC